MRLPYRPFASPFRAGTRLLLLAIATMLACTLARPATANPLENYTVATPVIVPAHAPGACIDQDPTRAIIVHLWSCHGGWNQAFRFRNAAMIGNDGPIQGEIWLGGSGCLTHQRLGADYSYVHMEYCRRAAEQMWTLTGGQIKGYDGRCLAVADASSRDGALIVAAPCKDVASQFWRLSSWNAEEERAAQRTGRPANTLMRNMTDAQIVAQVMPNIPLANIEQLTERDRPRIQPRKLTGDERAELRRLGTPLIGRNYEGPIPYSSYARLMKLAESGDREAMATLLRAFVSHFWRRNGSGYLYDPIDDGGTLGGGNQKLAHDRLGKLFALWSAHYWQLHGKNPDAALGISICSGWRAETRCGYLYDVPKKYAGRNSYHWWRTGKSEDFVEFQNIRFYSLAGATAGVGGGDEQGRFLKGLNALAFGWYGNAGAMGLGGDELRWVADYAARSGQARYFKNAYDRGWAAIQRGYSVSEKAVLTQETARAWSVKKVELQAEWNGLWPKPGKTLADEQRLEELAGRLDLLPTYMAEYPLRSWQNIETFCRAGYSAQCRVIETAEAEDRARRSAIANFFSGPLPSASVTVRNYDRNGNYVGSTITTRGIAELSGARPQ